MSPALRGERERPSQPLALTALLCADLCSRRAGASPPSFRRAPRTCRSQGWAPVTAPRGTRPPCLRGWRGTEVGLPQHFVHRRGHLKHHVHSKHCLASTLCSYHSVKHHAILDYSLGGVLLAISLTSLCLLSSGSHQGTVLLSHLPLLEGLATSKDATLGRRRGRGHGCCCRATCATVPATAPPAAAAGWEPVHSFTKGTEKGGVPLVWESG